MTYKLVLDRDGISINTRVIEAIEGRIFIPHDPDNTDYQKFKTDISNGAELQDPDGKVMTPKQVSDFIKTLP